MRLVIDADYIRYSAASVGETRSVLVVHNQSGREKIFKNRTEFWGRGKDKDGGWLGELNAKRTSPFLPEEFTIVDVQTPEPIENVLHTAKSMFETPMKALGTTNFVGFIGKGDSFRLERSTLRKYKGQRQELLKPLHLDAVTDYLHTKYKLEYVEHLEADDRCVIECYNRKDSVLVGVDKDYLGCPVMLYNPNKPEEGVRNCNQFGSLSVTDKGKVTGIGRMFFYFQMACGDKSDNYYANCESDVKWADKSTYNALVHAENDRDAIERVAGIFQHLYPEPKTVQGWRGDMIEIDWMYVANEMWDLARMRRWEDDVVTFTDVYNNIVGTVHAA